MVRPTLIDLFSGAGGISHGFERAGFRVLAGIDSDPNAIATFTRNHSGATGFCANLAGMSPAELSDRLRVKPGKVDCIAGGPPCQGFSRNRAFRHHGGVFVDDPRNHLYWQFFEFVAHLRPKVVVMENVPEILTKADGFFKEAVLEKFHSLGYEADAQVINASEFGVPQWRRRAIFLAGRDKQQVLFPNPRTKLGPRPGRRTPTSKDLIEPSSRSSTSLPLFDGELPEGPTVWDAISDLQGFYSEHLTGPSKYAKEPLSAYQEARRAKCELTHNHFPWRLSETQLKRIRLLTEGQGIHHVPEELRPKSWYGSAYRCMQSEAQALTITTWMFHPGSGMFTHPFADRVVTIREASRIQSFQDSFVFCGSYHAQCRQVGNSVAPLVALNIALAVLEVLGYPAPEFSHTGQQISKKESVVGRSARA